MGPNIYTLIIKIREISNIIAKYHGWMQKGRWAGRVLGVGPQKCRLISRPFSGRAKEPRPPKFLALGARKRHS
jgi:hypothetical protein